MRRIILLFIVMITSLIVYSKDPQRMPQNAKVNIGIKGGFGSTMYIVNKFKIKDVTIDEIQNNYKVGYSCALYFRFNMKRHFIQPEFIYNISKSEITFDKKGSQHPDIEPDYASIISSIRTVELPLLYGYNFIKTGPYGMCFFLGPKLNYVWKQKSKLSFSNFDQNGINEDLYPINISAVGGIGVTISRIFFDFRYEVGLHNISRSVIYDSIKEGQEQTSNIIFNRRSNTLSFSLGFIF